MEISGSGELANLNSLDAEAGVWLLEAVAGEPDHTI
jgi:hypothetical protein